MVFGTTLKLPGELFSTSKEVICETDFVKDLRSKMRELKPQQPSDHSIAKSFINKHLDDCKMVFVRNNTVRAALQSPYDGPFEIQKRYAKYFNIRINGKGVNISIDRLKPAFTASEEVTDTIVRSTPISSTTKKVTFDDSLPAPPVKKAVCTRYGRQVKPPVRFH